MLAFASINRRRVKAGLGHTEVVTSANVARLRRTIIVEFAIGLVVIGITSAMVVSPPATADTTLHAPVTCRHHASTTTVCSNAIF